MKKKKYLTMSEVRNKRNNINRIKTIVIFTLLQLYIFAARIAFQ